ncbi:glycoside hydrolase family 76 protein, partial [Glonium stellatum]
MRGYSNRDTTTLALTLTLSFALSPSTAAALTLTPSSPNSIRSTASTIAASIAAAYAPGTNLLPPPYYWWESGAGLDSLLTYYHLTGDTTHNAFATTALLSQASPTTDFLLPGLCTGNDDQAWWALAAVSASEFGVPTSGSSGPSWPALAQTVFAEQAARWDPARCGGGMKWKIAPADPGWHYKSAIANGLFFQLAARLARLTGDAATLGWAERAWNWSRAVGLVDAAFNVYDGTDDAKGAGCVDVDRDLWSYNAGVFLYGAAVMAEVT